MIRIFSPCKKCIVRACCSMTCIEYVRWSGKIEDMKIKLLIPFIVCVVFYDETRNRVIRVFGNVEAMAIVLVFSACMIVSLVLFYMWKGA